MQLGFVTAIFGDLSFEEVLKEAAGIGYDCVEVMCWPPGGPDRKYGGVMHLDCTDLSKAQAEDARALCEKHGVAMSALGYYSNPLSAETDQAEAARDHILRVIDAAATLELNQMNSFIGANHTLSLEDNFALFEKNWPDIVRYAEDHNVRIGIENCPMLFTLDEWPGGKNLAVSPEVWRRMFDAVPSASFGLNFDPSHLLWQGIDHLRAMREFKDRFVHVHIKDEKIDRERLYERGVMGLGWHSPKIPGLGDIDWAAFLRTLDEIGWSGPVCIEVEDRAFEDDLEGRKRAIRESKRHIDLVRSHGAT